MISDDPVDVRSIPQGLADAMTLAASRCWIAYKHGQPWLGDPDTASGLRDEDVKQWILTFQKGYMKEVERRQRAKLRQSIPIDFPSMPMHYQRALCSRWLVWRNEILEENPGLHWDCKRGFNWHKVTITTSAGETIERSDVPLAWANKPIVWRGRNIRTEEILSDLLSDDPL